LVPYSQGAEPGAVEEPEAGTKPGIVRLAVSRVQFLAGPADGLGCLSTLEDQVGRLREAWKAFPGGSLRGREGPPYRGFICASGDATGLSARRGRAMVSLA